MTKIGKNSKQATFGFGVLDFPHLEFIWRRFVSVRGAAFGFRASDLCRRRLGAIIFLEVVWFNIFEVRT